MRIIFKKSKTSLLTRIVTIFTGGNYGHVEIMFSDGLCFSAIPFVGVRIKRIHKLEDYDIIDIGTLKNQEKKIKKYCRSICGKKYDYKSILGFVFHYNFFNSERYYCSQLCAIILQKMGKFRYDYKRISPSYLFNCIAK